MEEPNDCIPYLAPVSIVAVIMSLGITNHVLSPPVPSMTQRPHHAFLSRGDQLLRDNRFHDSRKLNADPLLLQAERRQ